MRRGLEPGEPRGPRRPARTLAIAAVAAVVTAVACTAAALVWQQLQRGAALTRGQALYRGEAALPGRLAGHEADLPSLATRCVNCHEAGGTGPGSGTAYGAALNRQALALPRARRGGPPSAFDARTLCSLLRTGQDPALVIVNTSMPRYQPTEAQCADLWEFLISR